MKIIQKEVDVMVEEQTDYTTVGSTLTESQLAKIQTIVKAGGCYTKEADLANAKWRYFSTDDISTLFGINPSKLFSYNKSKFSVSLVAFSTAICLATSVLFTIVFSE